MTEERNLKGTPGTDPLLKLPVFSFWRVLSVLGSDEQYPLSPIKGSFSRVMSLNHVGLPRNYMNPLIPNIHVQILQTYLYTLP